MENCFHDSLTIERLIKAKPEKVFEAFKKVELKEQWFKAPSDEYKVAERFVDFRVGGKEVLRGSFPSGMTTSYDATFYDIVDNERIVYAYDLLLSGKRYSVTLATIEFRAENGHTRLFFTEQNTYINADAEANKNRIAGISWHLENLEKMFARA